MFIRAYIYSNSEFEAEKIFEKLIKEVRGYILHLRYDKVEKYWKFDDTYLVEVTIEFGNNINEEVFEKFLKYISDYWKMCGKPTDNILASKTTIGCNYIHSNVEMINIYLNKDEIRDILPVNSNVIK